MEMIVQAKLAAAAIALAGSAVLATPVVPAAHTEILIGPYSVLLGGRTPQFALAERCVRPDCALLEIVIRTEDGRKVRIEF